MNKLIIIFFISYTYFIFIQFHLLFQNTYAIVTYFKKMDIETFLIIPFFLILPHTFQYHPFHSQDKNEITKTISQIIIHLIDIYRHQLYLGHCHPHSINHQHIYRHNHDHHNNSIAQSGIYTQINTPPLLPQKLNITPDRYIPSPTTPCFSKQQYNNPIIRCLPHHPKYKFIHIYSN